MAEAEKDARQKMARAIRFALVGLSLQACGQTPRQNFDLARPLAVTKVSLAGGPALSVRPPSAVAPTSGDRIVVREPGGNVSVLPDVQWSERLPALLQDRLVEALQKKGLSAARISTGATVALATDIRRFEIDVARSCAVVEIAARLVSESTGVTRAAQTFLVETPAPEHTGAPAVQALAEGAAEAMGRIAAWARAKI
jgi:cholesterol transport system auxiliary component